MMSVAWQPTPYQLAIPGLVKKPWAVVHSPLSQVLLEFHNLKSSQKFFSAIFLANISFNILL